MILKDFSSLRPRTVFCMVSFVEKICVLGRSENLESGPTASIKKVSIIDVS